MKFITTTFKSIFKSKGIIKNVMDLPKDFIKDLISVIPKLLRISLVLIKKGRLSDLSRVLLAGAVFILSYIYVKKIITNIAVFFLVLLFTGPMGAISSLFFFNLARLVISILAIYVIAKVSVEIIDNSEIEGLAQELFGEAEAKDLMKKIKDINTTLNTSLERHWEKISKIFAKIGKRKIKKGFDQNEFDDIYENIRDKSILTLEKLD